MVRASDIHKTILGESLMKPLLVRASAMLILLSACTQPGQSQYGFQDVGKVTAVRYGVIQDVRPVDITGQNTGTGATVGVAGGALAGSEFGQGRGTLGAMLIGAVVGGIVGAATEQSLSDRRGLEYTIDLDDGQTITVVQNLKKEDKPLEIDQRCMVQTSGSYQRVLPSRKPFPDKEPVKHKHRHHESH
jgi:outer membrane lipoprotein SlyB